MAEPVPVTKEAAAAALREAAFTVTHKHCETCACDVPPDEQVIHSILSGLGADHNLETALARVEEADEIVWDLNIFQHDLRVTVGERVYRYQVNAPPNEVSGG